MRRAAEEDRAGHAARRQRLPEARILRVDAERAGVGTVDIALQHRRPALGQIADQLVADGRGVEADGARQNQQARVVARPQVVDDRRHQAQHAARALEPLQRGPVAVQPLEDLRMDRIVRLQPLQIAGLPALGREVAALLAVQRVERAAYVVAGRLVVERQEEPSAHDFESFLGADRLPDRLHAAERVLDARQRLPARVAPDLDVGLRDGRHEHCVATRPHRFGQLLNEGLHRVEAARHQAVDAVDLARIGDQFVDEDETRTTGVEQPSEGVGTRRHPLAIRGLHPIEELRVPGMLGELGRDLAPQSTDGDPGQIRGTAFARGIEGRADDDRDPRRQRPFDARLSQQIPDTSQLVKRRAPSQKVVQGEQGVGLAAAERGLELDDGFAPLAGNPLQRLDHQPAHAAGQIGAGEEFHGVLVLGFRPTPRYLREIRRELRLPVAARGHVGMRSRHFPPRLQSLPGNRGEHAGAPLRRRTYRCLHGGGRRRRPRRAVAHRAGQRPQALGGIGVDLFDESGRGVEGAPRVLVRHVEEPGMGPLVSRRDQFLDPRAVLAAQLAAKEIVPLHVHQPQAACSVELRNQ